MPHATASQTVGPFAHIGFHWLENGDLLAAAPIDGERIVIAGKLFDAEGESISDGVIEIWQADAQGRYAHPEDPSAEAPASGAGFTGFGRVATDADGAFRFSTLKPGRVAGPEGALQAPHIVVSVFARGVTKRLATRIYFPDEPANDDDPILALVPAGRRATLIARRLADATLEWNVRIQGEGETVFFDV